MNLTDCDSTDFHSTSLPHIILIFQFDGERLRCLKKEIVSCNKKPDLGKTILEPQGIKLKLSDLDNFFSRYSSIGIISV